MSQLPTDAEMDARVKAIAEQQGRLNPVTVRHVDPATLRPNGNQSGEAPKPSTKVKFPDGEKRKATAGLRGDAMRKREAIVTYLDRDDVGWASAGDIASVTGIARSYVAEVLRAMLASGIIEASGKTVSRRYRRPGSPQPAVEPVAPKPPPVDRVAPVEPAPEPHEPEPPSPEPEGVQLLRRRYIDLLFMLAERDGSDVVLARLDKLCGLDS